MLPPAPHAGATGTEVEVFRLLEAIPAALEEAIVFSSLNLSDHEYKKWGEIDFVVITQQGLLAIEVKGGQAHCDEKGIWRYESRGRRPVERLESPMAQVSDAFFSLREKVLYPAVGKAVFDAAPTGFLVILAKTSRQDASKRGLVGGPEMPLELVSTSEDLTGVPEIAGALSRAFAYWRKKERRPTRNWSRDEVHQIARAIRPWFDRVAPLSVHVARVREEQFALTEEQYRVLDFSDAVDRLLCIGGAGCGKTMLAVECLRREAKRNPLLVTGTHSLALHLRSSMGEEGARVVSYEELERLPRGVSCGCLIVDEGQQLTFRDALDRLSSVLDRGLRGGRWRWFADPNYQVLRTSSFDPQSYQLLKDLSFFGALTRNCRNTPQIAETVATVTGASLGAGARGQGPAVEFASSSDPAGQIAAAARAIKVWLEDPEIAPGDIVIVSPRPLEHSSAHAIGKVAGIAVHPWRADWSASGLRRAFVGAATVDDFRGMESPFVVLCDVDSSVEEPERVLYLGMTRANFGLCVLAEHDVIRQAVARAISARGSM